MGVILNARTGKVFEGNTRLFEAKRRGLDVDVPYTEHFSNLDEYFPDLD
jgi:hypothetical protein